MNKLYPAIKLLCNRARNLIKKSVPDNQDVVGNDGGKVEISSRLLQISEFKFFQLAYSCWYGRDISEKDMESIFADYMLKDEVPHWARHFARQVLSQYFNGVLDPHEYGIECIIPPRELNDTKVFITIFMILVYLFFYLILSGHITFQ
jgi:hypothetical protein